MNEPLFKPEDFKHIGCVECDNKTSEDAAEIGNAKIASLLERNAWLEDQYKWLLHCIQRDAHMLEKAIDDLAILTKEIADAPEVYILEPFDIWERDISFLDEFALAKDGRGYLHPADKKAKLIRTEEISSNPPKKKED